MTRNGFSKIIKFTIPLILLVTIGLACSQSACPQLDKPAPDFILEDLNGKEVSLSDYLGHDIILNFWATWCGYCKMQLPFIQEVYQKYSPSGLIVIAVNAGESYQQAANYMQEQGFTFPVLLDENGIVMKLYCVQYLPSTILLDAEGTIKYGKVGPFNDTEQLEAALLYLQ